MGTSETRQFVDLGWSETQLTPTGNRTIIGQIADLAPARNYIGILDLPQVFFCFPDTMFKKPSDGPQRHMDKDPHIAQDEPEH
jgi:hypothetical protein